MSNSAFSPTVLTIPGTGTSSSGQGELNLITNPVAAVNLDGWLGAGRGTSGGPLNPTIETYFTILNAFGSESSTSGAYDVISLPSGLQNKKLKVEFYFTSPANDTFKVSVYKGTTRVPLTTDVSGSTSLPKSTTGKFVAYFDTDSSGTWTVSITRTAGTGSTALQFTNVVVGPGIQPQGAVVGPETSYSLTVSGSSSAPTLGTNTAQATYERIGDIMHIRYSLKQTSAGTAGSGTYLFSLPSGFTVDSSRLATTYQGSTGLGALGPASLYDGTKQYTGYAAAYNSTNLFLVLGNEVSTPVAMGNTTYSFSGTNIWLSFDVRVPIAEWAGSGTVQLAQNDVEFSSNSNATNAVSDGSNFAYGPAGSLIPNGAVGTAYDRTIKFQTPLQASDVLSVEVDQGTGLWVPVDRRLTAWVRQGSLGYGIYVEPTTSTTASVSFGSGGFRSSSATYAANGDAWSVVSGWKWRVRKSSAGAAVGFGIVQPGVSSGLVSAAGLPGNTTGSAIASGYVGELFGTAQAGGTGGSPYITTSSTNVTTTLASVVSQTVNKGVYLATVSGFIQKAANTNGDRVYGYWYIGGTQVGATLISSSSSNVLSGFINITLTSPVLITADSTAIAFFAASATDSSQSAGWRLSLVRIS